MTEETKQYIVDVQSFRADVDATLEGEALVKKINLKLREAMLTTSLHLENFEEVEE